MTSELVNAIKSTPTPIQVSTPTPMLPGVNWTPIVQGLVSGLATSFGATINFPTSTAIPVASSAVPTSGEVQNVQPNLVPIQAQLTELTNNFKALNNKVNNFESMLTRLAESQVSTNNQINALAQQWRLKLRLILLLLGVLQMGVGQAPRNKPKIAIAGNRTQDKIINSDLLYR